MFELPSGYKKHSEPMVMVIGDAKLFESKNDSYSRDIVIRFLAVDIGN